MNTIEKHQELILHKNSFSSQSERDPQFEDIEQRKKFTFGTDKDFCHSAGPRGHRKQGGDFNVNNNLDSSYHQTNDFFESAPPIEKNFGEQQDQMQRDEQATMQLKISHDRIEAYP